MLTYGDGLADIDLNALIASHYDSGKTCTISAVHPAGRFGGISIQEGGLVSNFEEKPLKDKSYINGGFMVCDPKIFDYFSQSNEMFEERPINRIVADLTMPVATKVGGAPWIHSGNCLGRTWDKRKAPWKVW